MVARNARGQALIEYSLLNLVVIAALIIGSTIRILPGPVFLGGRMNVIEAFLYAYQIYYDSFYFVLNAPIP
jgi:hypothetical protein